MNTLPPLPAPGKFRKLPVVIDASQWFKNGDHPLDYAEDTHGLEGGELRIFTGAERKANDWEGGVVRYFRHPDVPGEKPCEQCGKTHHVHGWIDTLEQGHRVCPGDWIITGVAGEMYPCKPLIFDATYEPALAAIAAQAMPEPVAATASESVEMKKAITYSWLLKLDLEATYEALGMDYWQTDIETAVAAIHALRAVQPVQPTPLTKDQLSAALRSVDPLMARLPAGLEEFARAIEQAHGIGSPGAPSTTGGAA